MKSVILFLCIFFHIANLSYAQDNKSENFIQHKFFIGGSTSLKIENFKVDSLSYAYDNKGYTFDFQPKIGIMLTPKFALGVKCGVTIIENALYMINYNFDSSTEMLTVDGKLMNISLILRYQNIIVGNLNYFADANAGVAFTLAPIKMRNGYGQYSYNNNYLAGVGLGFLYFVSKRLALEMQVINLEYSEFYDYFEDKKISQFNTEFIFSNPNISLTFYF